MARSILVDHDGSFLVGNRRHRIPERFSDRQIHSFRTLLEPIPDTPSGPAMSAQLRRKQRDYLLRRSLAAVIPGLPLHVLQRLSMRQVRVLHEWIARHRPELVADLEVQLD
ncbi:MAG: hypothetical protein JSV86_04150 [Gemmatimonadota bacterium]|nr:MAG: hypothetical protein JSV86_04150 [Gemmatimonadota bacterium]